MDEKEILENNILIAKFIGRNGIVTSDLYTFLGLYDIIGDIWVSKFDMKFHSSYDWLKPVIDRIGDLIETGDYYHARIMNMTIFSSLEDTYQACIEFIKYYNEKIRTL